MFFKFWKLLKNYIFQKCKAYIFPNAQYSNNLQIIEQTYLGIYVKYLSTVRHFMLIRNYVHHFKIFIRQIKKEIPLHKFILKRRIFMEQSLNNLKKFRAYNLIQFFRPRMYFRFQTFPFLNVIYVVFSRHMQSRQISIRLFC